MKPGDLVKAKAKTTSAMTTIVKSDGVTEVGEEITGTLCIVLEHYRNAVKVLCPDGRIKCAIADQWEVVSECR